MSEIRNKLEEAKRKGDGRGKVPDLCVCVCVCARRACVYAST